MAERNVLDGRDATLTVPAEHFPRFRRELLFEVSAAADSLSEDASWAHDIDKPAEFRAKSLKRLSAEGLPRLHGAERVWREIEAVPVPAKGDTPVTGDEAVLRSIVIGCVLTSSEAIGGAVEGFDTLSAGRAAVAGLNYWLDRLEEIGDPQADERAEAA